MYRVEISTLAGFELADAFDWYETRRTGLGEELLEEFRTVCSKVRDRPLMFPQVAGGARRARMKRFPYGVFFVIGPERIVVTAFFHFKRDPRYLHNRQDDG